MKWGCRKIEMRQSFFLKTLNGKAPGTANRSLLLFFDDVKRQDDRLIPVKVWELKCNQAVSSAGLALIRYQNGVPIKF